MSEEIEEAIPPVVAHINTTHEEGLSRRLLEHIAKTQENLVRCLFLENPDETMTPSAVHEVLIRLGHIGVMTPLTSIRRAICKLSEKGDLQKTEIKKIGVFGRPEYTWALRKAVDRLPGPCLAWGCARKAANIDYLRVVNSSEQ